MSDAYTHDAVLDMDPDADLRAPGAAVTVELCGHWDHEPPCPLAPHHTTAERSDRDVRLRILFTTQPHHEGEVRRGIGRALTSGRLDGPDDVTTRWLLVSDEPGTPTPAERDHAARLATG